MPSRATVSVRLLCMALLLTAGACAVPISKQLRQAAEQAALTFPRVLENPDIAQGAIVLWGGKIIETVTLKDGTDIIVLEIPLDFEGEPKEARHSRGRFIARSDRFLDPAVYKPGWEVTLAGGVIGAEERALGETRYRYPVVQIKELYLWEPYRYRYYPYYPLYYWGAPFRGPYYYGPLYYRDWDHDHHGRLQGRGGKPHLKR